MALINCPECGRQISDRAPSCPGCGILKEDIQAMIAEQNASHSSKEENKKSNNNDVLESQGTEEELLCYPTISALSERERTQYSEKHETKSQKSRQTGKTERTEKSFKVGDSITFGTQYDEPISWIVLEIKGDDMLLLSEKCLEVRQYHSEKKPVTWETSDIRRYLNGEFLEKYFSNHERQIIKQRNLSNSNNTEYNTKGGNSTLDNVFLLSSDEAKRFFQDNAFHVCKASKYARKQARKKKVLIADDGTIVTNRWLRSPGRNQESAASVFDGGYGGGYVIDLGSSVNELEMIRPALVVHSVE